MAVSFENTEMYLFCSIFVRWIKRRKLKTQLDGESGAKTANWINLSLHCMIDFGRPQENWCNNRVHRHGRYQHLLRSDEEERAQHQNAAMSKVCRYISSHQQPAAIPIWLVAREKAGAVHSAFAYFCHHFPNRHQTKQKPHVYCGCMYRNANM